MKFPPSPSARVRLACSASRTPSAPQTLTCPAARAKPLGANWQAAGGLGGRSAATTKLHRPTRGAGILVTDPTKEAESHLVTAWDRGDVELDLDFLLTTGSNSGRLPHGSPTKCSSSTALGATTPTSSDCGGIYSRWDAAARGAGEEKPTKAPPPAPTPLAPRGLWQHRPDRIPRPTFRRHRQETRQRRNFSAFSSTATSSTKTSRSAAPPAGLFSIKVLLLSHVFYFKL